MSEGADAGPGVPQEGKMLARRRIVVPLLACLAGCAAMGGKGPNARHLVPAAVVATIPIERPPTLLASSPDGSRVVAASSGELAIIRTDTNVVAATVRIAPYSSGVAVTPDGRHVLVNSISSSRLTVVDVATATVEPDVGLIVDIPPGGFGRMAVSPDGRRAYVANQPKDYLALVDLNAGSTNQFSLDMSPTDVTLGADGRTLFVTGCKDFCTTGTVEVIDAASRQTIRSFEVGPAPYRFALSPDGTRAYTTNLGGPTLSIVDVASGATIATVPVGVRPSGLAVSPDGTRVYVAGEQQETLTIVDADHNTVRATFSIPNHPREVVISPDGRRAYVSTQDAVLVLDTERL